jgi:large subunit ribosomal protein L22
MEARAVARYVRVSPRKARLVVDLVRGKSASEAATILRFTEKGSAEVIGKVLASAVANAEHNLKLKPETLYVSEAFVNQGPSLKRIQPRAMGRAFKILKRSAHITIVVKQREGA